MASFDPFEKEFGRHARSLRRTPAPRSWDQLEARLDRRRNGTRILGIRPWVLAAIVLIVAGVSVISNVGQQRNNPLAKRAEFIEDLSSPYVPTEAFQPQEYLPGHAPASTEEQDPTFRDVVVAEKYRVQG